MRDLDLLILQVGARRYCELKGSSNHLVNLMLHRFGVWKWALGAKGGVNNDSEEEKGSRDSAYTGMSLNEDGDEVDDDAETGWASTSEYLEQFDIRGEIDNDDNRDMFDEFLWFLVVFLSELPRPRANIEREQDEEGKREETKDEMAKRSQMSVLQKVRSDIRKEVVHRLAVGPQTHSALTEVYGLMSPREMQVIKLIGGDDGELLEDVLKEVAVNKIGQGLSPNKWHLKPRGWEEYDPCFYHLNEKGHQMAAANRTEKWGGNGEVKGGICKPLGKVAEGWGDFRKSIFWEDTVRAIVWRTVADNMGSGKGGLERQSETGLARVVQLLTLGMGVMDQEGGDELERWEEVSAVADWGGANRRPDNYTLRP
jgi:hypothetical protein